jgi:hypothetical protein
MFAGVTHLTTEANLDEGTEYWTELGFHLQFIDAVELPHSFENVDGGNGSLPLAMLAMDGGIRLEVVQHPWRTGRLGPYSAVFRCAPPKRATHFPDRPAVRQLLQRGGVLRDPVCAVVTADGGEAWFESSNDEPANGIDGILCRVADVRVEAAYWAEFARYRFNYFDQSGCVARVSSPAVRSKHDIVLVQAESESESESAMNDCGFPSIGVYTTSVDGDCRRAVSAGATVRAAPIVTTVGGRQVQMALIETPGGALVELLAVIGPPRDLRSETTSTDVKIAMPTGEDRVDAHSAVGATDALARSKGSVEPSRCTERTGW